MHATDEPYCYIENLSSENIEKCKSENGLLSKLENVFVASFSYDKENNNNKYMWNYYSDGLNGFCLEFDKDEIIKKVLSQFDGFAVSSGEVKYYPIKECLDAVGADNDSELSAENIDKFLMRKSLLWAKEKEYRIVISKKQMQGTIKCGRCVESHGIYIQNIRPQAIYVGYRMDCQTKKDIFKYAEANNILVIKVENSIETKEGDRVCLSVAKDLSDLLNDE